AGAVDARTLDAAALEPSPVSSRGCRARHLSCDPRERRVRGLLTTTGESVRARRSDRSGACPVLTEPDERSGGEGSFCLRPGTRRCRHGTPDPAFTRTSAWHHRTTF